MATIEANGDVTATLGVLKFKVRTERITIYNDDPANKRVEITQSARLLDVNGNMGRPFSTQTKSIPIDAAFASQMIDSLSGAGAVTWIATWAAGINYADADGIVAALIDNVAKQLPVA